MLLDVCFLYEDALLVEEPFEDTESEELRADCMIMLEDLRLPDILLMCMLTVVGS